MTAERLVRNAGVSTVVYLLGSVVGLILVPILISSLGAAGFGLYVLAQTTLAFSSLAGGGLNRGFVRSIVAHTEQDGPSGARRVIATGATLMMGFGLIVIALVVALFPLLRTVYQVNATQASDFAWVLGGATVAYALVVSVTPYQSLLVARGRLDLAKSVEGTLIVASSLASGYAAVAGFGLRGVGIAVGLVAAPIALATFVLAVRTDARCALVAPAFDVDVFRELWQFGSRIQLATLSAMVNRSIDRVSLGALRSPIAVGLYDVADRGAFSIVYTANTATEALVPRMASHLANDDTEGAKATYTAATSVFSTMSLFLAAFAACNSWLFIRVWLGTADPSSVWAMTILSIGYGVGVSMSAAHLIATAQATPTLAMRYSVVQAAVNVALSFTGAWLGGIVGAALGSALSGAIGALILGVLVERRILKQHSPIALKSIAKAALVVLPVGVALAAAVRAVDGAVSLSRPIGLAALGVVFALQLISTIALGSRVGLLPDGTLSSLTARLRRRP
ncbi:MAG: oligosaccharide flippase family protein [Coriobacteriia bacterium]|nr:oligosaccharide flippase family protein [Coriobacteriia bacterium]